MSITPKNFSRITIVLAVLVLVMLPFWRYSRWGYAPSMALAAALICMFALRRLARD
jgi:hypothetical protein